MVICNIQQHIIVHNVQNAEHFIVAVVLFDLHSEMNKKKRYPTL